MPATNAMAELATPQSQISLLISKSLPQLVQMELERLILSGELHAGERLNEVAIAERLRVSRGPVREALRTLQEAGLVRFEKNRGATVRVMTPEEAVEIYEIRASLESLACRRLAGRVTREQMAELTPLVDEMQRAAEVHDVAAFHRDNMRFHDLLVEYAGNGELVVMYRRLVGNLNLFRRHTLAQEGSLAESNAEHRAILERLAGGDADAAGRCMQDHIGASSARTQHALSHTPKP